MKWLDSITDLEPSLKKVEEAMTEVSEFCECEARNANGLIMHKKAKHTTDNCK